MSEVRVSRIGFVQAALRSRAVEAPRELRELAPSPGTRRTTVQEREVVKARATARPSRPLSCFPVSGPIGSGKRTRSKFLARASDAPSVSNDVAGSNV